MKLLFFLLYGYMLLLPFVGLYQAFRAIWAYSIKEKPKDYYKDLERYGMMVVGFFGLWIIASLLPTKWFSSLIGSFVSLFYIFILPLGIAIYHNRIMRRSYYEEIEKLIH